MLGRAGRLTPAGLRAAIAHAVIAVAPEKARKRREHAARDARVQRWEEDSGNAALMGRELPLPHITRTGVPRSSVPTGTQDHRSNSRRRTSLATWLRGPITLTASRVRLSGWVLASSRG